MANNIRARISGIGSYFPSQVITNDDLAKIVDTSDEWISTRTGIKERRKLRDNEQNSDMAAGAGAEAIKKAGITPADIDCVIGCTTSPDRWMPSLACTVQAKLGIPPNGPAFDVLAACSGWVTGLQVAEGLIRSGIYKNVLVIGSEALSRFVNWEDRATCVLFGDAAGASVVTAGKAGDSGEIIDVRVISDGRYGEILDLPGGGSRTPATHKMVDDNLQYIRMNGQEVFKHAVRNMAQVCETILEDQKLTMNDIAWLIPHQANIRIIEAVGKKLNAPAEKVALNVHKYGNTSSATVPTCLDEYAQAGKVKKGDLVLMATFGGGITWAGLLIRW